MAKKIKALALFSGGLDSALAIKIIKDQGIEVIALNFISYFFGGKDEKAEKMATQLGVQLEYVDFSEKHIEMMKNPVYGRGKNMNPCIDCHALMFKFAGELLEKYKAQFLISGEVLGQRPMSQNYQALEKVKSLSNLEQLIVRPLSAKLLPPSKAELDGLIDREKLLDLQGRGRKRQIELAKNMGLIDYPSPAGGCLLTDPGYSKRLKIMEEDGFLEKKYNNIFELLKKVRFFRFEKGKYLFVGRTKEDNETVLKYKNIGSMFIRGNKVSGPYIIGYGDLTKENINFAKDVFSRYCKFKGDSSIQIFLNEKVYSVDIIDKEKFEENTKRYQVLMD